VKERILVLPHWALDQIEEIMADLKLAAVE